MAGCEEDKARKRKIENEEKRLSTQFKEIDAKKRAVVRGLLPRAAFMRIHLCELEADLNIYGWTEWFSQGEQEPYKRNRPEADQYHKLNANYQKIIKQLTDLLPKDEAKPSTDDGFADFVSGREDE